jgi:hypothetical protein
MNHGIGMNIVRSLFEDIKKNPWVFVPAAATLLFAGVMALLLRQKNIGARRRALLIASGTIAVSAGVAFAAFVWSFIRLLERSSRSFDTVWIAGATAAGLLTGWLWLRFYKVARTR